MYLACRSYAQFKHLKIYHDSITELEQRQLLMKPTISVLHITNGEYPRKKKPCNSCNKVTIHILLKFSETEIM